MARIRITEEYTVSEPAMARIAEEFMEWIDVDLGVDAGKRLGMGEEYSYADLAKKFAREMENRGVLQ